jgi:hypothetical protein
MAAGLFVEEGRRRLLDHLLVAALDRAFALAEVEHVAVLSPSTWISMWRGSVMNFSMKTRSSPKEPSLRSVGAETVAGLGVVIGDAHALAAAAGRGLDHHGIADLAAIFTASSASSMSPVKPGTVDTPASLGELLGDSILSPMASMAWGRADEDDLRLRQRLGELRVLGEEAVAGMHGLGARLPCRRR